jgi:hypothetical protein
MPTSGDFIGFLALHPLRSGSSAANASQNPGSGMTRIEGGNLA